MKLTILGSGSALINKKRTSASMMLEARKKLLLFDCGWGAPLNIVRASFDIQKINQIFISHPHADHMGSLINILQSTFVSGIFYPKTKRTQPLYLHGYRGFKNDLDTLIKIMSPELKIVKLPFEIKVFEYEKDQKIIDNLKIYGQEVRHFPDEFHSVAFRVEYLKKSFVYSGDCGYDENLIKIAKNADLTVLEMSLGPLFHKNWGTKPNHLTPFECGLLASHANIKQMALIHIFDGFGTNKEIENDVHKNFNGKLYISHDLQTISF
ncbi:MAG: ribonuclease Z [Candidatus Berkelbacteria bacterium]|nr:ribonuclease Z [Candidatus Berkelbacteria bacterium]